MKPGTKNLKKARKGLGQIYESREIINSLPWSIFYLDEGLLWVALTLYLTVSNHVRIDSIDTFSKDANNGLTCKETLQSAKIFFLNKFKAMS